MAVVSNLLSVAEFAGLPQRSGGIRQELRHGELFESPPVKMLHTRIQQRLVSLLKAVLKGFLTTPDLDDRIVGFMRHDIGLPLRPYLEETAEKHPKKNLRARARAELDAGR